MLLVAAGIARLDAISSRQSPHDQTIGAAQNGPSGNANKNEPTKTFGRRLTIVWDRTWEDPVAFYTFVLSIFTGLLFIVSSAQIFFLVRSDKTARITAEAANLSAKAAIALELPIVRADPDFFSWDQRSDGDLKIDSFSIGQLVFYNLGRTKTFPIEVRFGYFVGSKLPDSPVYNFTKAFSVGAVIDSEPFAKSTNEFEFDVAPGTFNGLREGSIRLWFYCNLIYEDFMQSQPEAGLCWERWQRPGTGDFRVDPTPNYNKKT